MFRGELIISEVKTAVELCFFNLYFLQEFIPGELGSGVFPTSTDDIRGKEGRCKYIIVTISCVRVCVWYVPVY